MSLQRVTALRALMKRQPRPLHAYIVPTADAHNSEYISACDARREWLSGFTGSAGTAIVTDSHALVWTDGRYYTQFEKEADMSLWTLMKQSLPDTPSMEKWLASNLSVGACVGVDPHTMHRDEWTPLQTALTKAKMNLIPVSDNLVDTVRVELNDPPPARPSNAVLPLDNKYTGKMAGDKIKALQQKMVEKKASLLVIAALDEVAYTLNLRGSDIEYNPVFFSYLVISPSAVKIFWHNGQLSHEVQEHLRSEGVDNFEGLPYNRIVDDLQETAKSLSECSDGNATVWLPSEASEAVHRAASGSEVLEKPLNLISEVSPVALMKLIKNNVEMQGFRKCHVRDGVAVVRLLRWLHERVAAGSVTEVQVADKLLEFRKEEADFMGPSFSTIAGAGENGAIIHYTATREGPQRVITTDDMFLLDSGGQYKDGTTDITRTRHMGTPSEEQKDAFTRVLKGQIMLGSALFPRGVKGNVLDSFARKSLWDVGLDYGHGTGHGVGHFLNVHEGPSGVSWRPYPRDPGLQPGQVLSNEPGYYKVGAYGIRHEDLVETILVTKDSDHPRLESEFYIIMDEAKKRPNIKIRDLDAVSRVFHKFGTFPIGNETPIIKTLKNSMMARYLKGNYEGRGVLGFRTMTLAPHDTNCIDVNMLDDFELSYLNAYHARVLEVVGAELKRRRLSDDLAWLETQCTPLTRA